MKEIKIVATENRLGFAWRTWLHPLICVANKFLGREVRVDGNSVDAKAKDIMILIYLLFTG
jgi:hypothetical protein